MGYLIISILFYNEMNIYIFFFCIISMGLFWGERLRGVFYLKFEFLNIIVKVLF